MPGFTNDYIEKLMNKISTKPKDFKGVLPCDVFLNKVKEDQLLLKDGNCFIINLSSSNHNGSHFVSLFITPGKVVEYFDSFGIPSLDSNINNALTSFKIEVFSKTIQSISSQFCGLYCSKYVNKNPILRHDSLGSM